MPRIRSQHPKTPLAKRGQPATRYATCLLEALEDRMLLSSLVVNTVNDGIYPASMGLTSLRMAIAAANTESSTPGTVTFDPTIFTTPQTIRLGGFLLWLQNITITGPTVGVTIDGSQQSTVFDNVIDSTATLSNLTITNASGTGVVNHGTLNLNNSTISNNMDSGLVNHGSATLTNVDFIGNNAPKGGGIYNGSDGNLTFTQGTVSNNTAEEGGGIYSVGFAALTDVVISTNSAAINGAGIFTTLGSLSLLNCAISNNTAAANGGGIYALNSAVTSTNVTLTGNSTTTGNGGGLCVMIDLNLSIRTVATSTLTNNTIYANSAVNGGGIFNPIMLGINLANSVVAGNMASFDLDLCGSLVSFGNNFIGIADGSNNWLPTDFLGTAAAPLNPNFLPMATSGISLGTWVPQQGSPLIDHGANAMIPLNTPTDQRGEPRIYNTTVDIGAVEWQPSDATASEQLVTNLYHDTLGRAPDPAGFLHWTTALNNGSLPANQLASCFTSSTEYRTKRIREIYQSILGRAAETAGLNSWLNYLNTGHTIAQLRAGFYGSAEYFSLHGGNNTALTTAYYGDILGRAPDAGGLAYWTGQLNQGTDRTTVALAIMCGSVEGASKFVSYCYTTYLRRAPDSAGLQSWISQVRNGASEIMLVTAFLSSEEYIQRT